MDWNEHKPNPWGQVRAANTEAAGFDGVICRSASEAFQEANDLRAAFGVVGFALGGLLDGSRAAKVEALLAGQTD